MSDSFPPSLEELKETFDFLEEWDERYEYIIELGKQVPQMPAETQVDENRVHGCMSSVWLIAERQAETGAVVIQADSDSLIVKGLIAILTAAYAGMTPEELLKYDVSDVLSEFGLNQHLSPNRRNGLFSMVKRVKELAAEM